MCTVVFLLRPGHAWPLLLAANRDERVDRPWDPPGPFWPEQPGLVAGRDRLGGGTWMAACGGVVAAVLNRSGSLGPQMGKRSRGDLPLLAAAQDSARAGADAIQALDGRAYRSFNMVVADRDGAFFLRSTGDGQPQVVPMAPGVHMVTAYDVDDLASPRAARFLPRFRAAAVPDPDRDDWAAWLAILSDRSGPAGTEINVPVLNGFGRDGFGTVCSSLLGVARDGRVTWLFAGGPPDTAPMRPVLMPQSPPRSG